MPQTPPHGVRGHGTGRKEWSEWTNHEHLASKRPNKHFRTAFILPGRHAQKGLRLQFDKQCFLAASYT